MIDARHGFVAVVVALALAAAACTPSTASAITAWDAADQRPKPCPSLAETEFWDGKGGCSFSVRGQRMRFTVQSFIGDLRFATCKSNHVLHIDARGRTKLDTVIGGEAACGDVRACTADGGDSREPALMGRLERVGPRRLVNRVDGCLDTCMGQFAGSLEMVFRRGHTGRWESVVHDELGTSGFRLDGRLLARGDDFEIRP